MIEQITCLIFIKRLDEMQQVVESARRQRWACPWSGPFCPKARTSAAFLSERAATRGMSLNDLVNALLKKDIELIEAAE